MISKEKLESKALLINYFLGLPNEAFVDDEVAAAFTNTKRSKWQCDRVRGGGVPFCRFGRKCLYKKSDILAHFVKFLDSTAQGQGV